MSFNLRQSICLSTDSVPDSRGSFVAGSFVAVRPSFTASSFSAPPEICSPSPLQRWMKESSNFRLRLFAQVAHRTCRPFVTSLFYVLFCFNILIPFAAFLHFVALPNDQHMPIGDELKSTNFFNLGLAICSGIINFVLFLLGVGAVKDRVVVVVLGLDVAVWFAVSAAWAMIVLTDEWHDKNIYLLSFAGLLNAIHLNTFMLVNTALEPLAKMKPGIREKRTISTKFVEQMINECHIKGNHKAILKEELWAVNWESQEEAHSELNQEQFFYFSNKARGWANEWDKEEDHKEMAVLLGKMNFVFLLASEEIHRDPIASTESEKSSLDALVEDQDFSPVTAFLLSVKYLITGQKLRATAITFTLVLRAITQYAFYFLTGDLVNIASSLANGDEGQRGKFIGRLIIYVVVVVANNTTDFIVAALGSKLISNATARLQRQMTEKILHSSNSFEEAFLPGYLANTFNASLAKLNTLWNEMWYRVIFPISILVTAIAFFCAVDIGYALFVAVSLPALICTKNLVGDRAGAASEKFTESNACLLDRFQNLVSLRKATQVYQSHDYLQERMEERITDARINNYWSLLWGNMLGAIFTSTGNILIIITSIVLLFALSTGKISPGEFLSLLNYVYGVFGPLENLGLMSSQVSYFSGAVFSIEKLLEYEVDESNGERTEPQKDEVVTGPLTLQNSLTFNEVGFRYGPSTPFIIENISTTISAGTFVAIFGPSGSGKSTLLSLVEGIHSCTRGQICMDGVDIALVPRDRLFKSLAVVFQETYVLDGTIRDNIVFGYHDTSIEAVKRAAEDAQIHSFIESLPEKYETVIGVEADISLSGGQLQRICGLARALIRRPSLLVLDEATSALDTISEKSVINTVLLLRNKGMTTISVSHRPSTAVDADKIIVLSKGGNIAQSGTYSELLEQGGLFEEIVRAGS